MQLVVPTISFDPSKDGRACDTPMTKKFDDGTIRRLKTHMVFFVHENSKQLARRKTFDRQ